MFETLTAAERHQLACRLARAQRRFLNEYDLLRDAPPAVLATYQAIPADWLMCCVDTRLVLRDLHFAERAAGYGPDEDDIESRRIAETYQDAARDYGRG